MLSVERVVFRDMINATRLWGKDIHASLRFGGKPCAGDRVVLNWRPVLQCEPCTMTTTITCPHCWYDSTWACKMLSLLKVNVVSSMREPCAVLDGLVLNWNTLRWLQLIFLKRIQLKTLFRQSIIPCCTYNVMPKIYSSRYVQRNMIPSIWRMLHQKNCPRSSRMDRCL